ncbi:2-oxo acid dehydrogenase subunit E2 [Streptomyces sp. NPDC091265]|jgi:pyruvate/2-oxoglutarate dehydrogenase complex dihydrolipoamide acyltransferase (E2) component|uniref:2-oxo acid dehydrogenase subunit E2 n=1 Tax=unclassified Streptomyces TaxID=2593676 RepID=UPI00344F92D9
MVGGIRIDEPARERRHTLFFLEEIKDFAPVFLDTEIDTTRVQEHRDAARRAGVRYSVVSYVLVAAAQVLATHPEANAAFQGGRRPRVARFEEIAGKVTLDKEIDGTRLVLATVVPEPHTGGLDGVQRILDRIRDTDPADLPELARLRELHTLPWRRGRALFRKAARALELRPRITGTFAVTSLGHRAVDGFHSVGGTTLTLGVGRVTDRPVVRDGSLAVAPVLRLSLSFDHRVIDGAEAADVLTEIRQVLQDWPAHTEGEEDGATPGRPAAEAVPAPE